MRGQMLGMMGLIFLFFSIILFAGIAPAFLNVIQGSVSTVGSDNLTGIVLLLFIPIIGLALLLGGISNLLPTRE